MDPRSQAKTLLVHYFDTVGNGVSQGSGGDCAREIESIVDLIVDAAVHEAREQLQQWLARTAPQTSE